MTIIRRLGPDPHLGGRQSSALKGCPDILELQNGDFAIIGIDITAAAIPHLALGASCGPDERMVRVPRQVLIGAKADIPDA